MEDNGRINQQESIVMKAYPIREDGQRVDNLGELSLDEVEEMRAYVAGEYTARVDAGVTTKAHRHELLELDAEIDVLDEYIAEKRAMDGDYDDEDFFDGDHWDSERLEWLDFDPDC